MIQDMDLKKLEKSTFTAFFEDGLTDILIGSFVSLFAIAPLLSSRLGDFWSSVVFLPVWVLIFLVIRHVRKNVTMPRLGTVRYGTARKRRLRIFTITMLVVNVVALGLGFFASRHSTTSGLASLVWFCVIMLVGFSAAAYFLDFPRLYAYGMMVALSPIAGEWLYKNMGASHHGFPITFGITSGVMALVGMALFLQFLRRNAVLEDVSV